MKYLVTGGAGFIGSALCLKLLNEASGEVVCLDRLSYAANPVTVTQLQAFDRFRMVKQDIRDTEAVCNLVAEEKPDIIFHLAAETHVDRSIDSAGAFIETNILGTYSLLEAARSHHQTLPASPAASFRFVHISTDEVFGSLGDTGAFTEETPYDPSSPYSASKAGSDHLVNAWHRTYGLPTIISNCSNNYGPRQFPEKLIPLMILNAVAGQPLPVYGDGRNVRDWLHVDDHAAALFALAEKGKPGETYNVGGSSERSNIDVVQQICRILDKRFPDQAPHDQLIEFVADRPGHDRRYAVSTQKIEGDIGWVPSHDFESGLEATVDWYLSNEDWWRPVRDEQYGGERLGLSGAPQSKETA